MSLRRCRAHFPRARHTIRALTPSLRTYATESTTESAQAPLQESSPPRWSQTPAGMKAPMQLDFAKSFKNKIWKVNNDPAKLDNMYNRLLGPGGSKMLPEELKWLAVTHKSFDQGRRGFNDKLALMGRLTLVMEATKEIVSKPPLRGSRQADEFDRAPFEHEQLAPVDNLSVEGPKDVVGKEKLYALASDVGVLAVLRWKPRLPENLKSSGVEVVVNGAVLAILGAITLQHGSVVASRVVRERIFARLAKID
ncbi:Ribonuclease III [Metarhizium album ARSEF 1941]|uniref:Ribonuclease III n=1 Tax=Metarhizium album (strain ARSEF 1941) TaxID=1081103 RepID=A0A0B2WML6_METAS|nr:Ribonuclease III [Metarhizium album ARSEF 1941]KHN94944.1 Ribonuclease III [Metarhizium album ARSEF 1941]